MNIYAANLSFCVLLFLLLQSESLRYFSVPIVTFSGKLAIHRRTSLITRPHLSTDLDTFHSRLMQFARSELETKQQA